MCIIQIGELTTRLSDDFQDRHNKIPWNEIKATRNVFVHAYGDMNIEETWYIIINDVPELKEYCQKILQGL